MTDEQGTVRHLIADQLLEEVTNVSGTNVIPLQTTDIPNAAIRLGFTDVIVARQEFKIEFVLDDDTDRVLHTSENVTATDVVGGLYELDETIDFNLYEAFDDEAFYIRFTSTAGDVIISGGTVELRSRPQESIRYDSFGMPLPGPDYLAPALSIYRAGREWDDFTNLYYNRARWYDPAIGRFISADPIGFVGGDANLYRYCGNSPANATDPSGEIWGWAAAGIGAGVTSLGYLAYVGLTDAEFSWQDLGTSAAVGATAGLLVGAFTGDASAGNGIRGHEPILTY